LLPVAIPVAGGSVLVVDKCVGVIASVFGAFEGFEGEDSW
jgi:hypothetical protein